MRLRFLKHPVSGKPDLFITLSFFAVIAAITRFLGEGLSVAMQGHAVIYTMHTDPSAYALFLAPILGAHGYLEMKNPPKEGPKDEG